MTENEADCERQNTIDVALGFDPRKTCPNCESGQVYENGIDAKEFVCPECGWQYNPDHYQDD